SWQPTNAWQPSPDKWSPIAPSPLGLSMANLDMSVHDIPLPYRVGPLSTPNQEVSLFQSPMFAPSPCLPSWPVASNPIIESRSPSIDAPSPRLPQLTFPSALHDDIPDAPSPQLPSWQPTHARQPSPDERS